MTNCYKILGVEDFASAEEVKTAYRKLSKKFHPDINEGDKFFEERLGVDPEHAYAWSLVGISQCLNRINKSGQVNEPTCT